MHQKISGAVAPQPLPRETVAARAYQIYRDRGCQPGHDVDDWLQAEYELLHLPIRKIAAIPAPRRDRRRFAGKSIVTLVQAAVLASGRGMTDLLRWR